MCQSKKGPGYDPVDVVKQAIANLGVTVDSFFAAAKHHTKSSFKPEDAAAAYVAQKPGYVIPPQVVTFADWVQMKGEGHYVRLKYPMLVDAPKIAPQVLGLEAEVALGLG